MAIISTNRIRAISARVTRNLFQRPFEVFDISRRRYASQGWPSARTFLFSRLFNLWQRARNRWRLRDRVHCPCCGWRGHDFLAVDCGKFIVFHAECPHCQGHERHRMLTLYLKRHDKPLFQNQASVLHCAPEGHVRDMLLTNPGLRITGMDCDMYMAKRFSPPAFVADIQQLAIADDSFDFIFCLHVLEHVPDYRKGLAELARALRPGGKAYVMVPFIMERNETLEYGQPDPFMFDHVREFSPHDFDLAPFKFEKITRHGFLTPQEMRQYRIPEKEILFCCTKQN